MAKYQNQFLGTASYNGDILFWNVSMLKPILNFNASESPLPLQPKKVQCPVLSQFPRRLHSNPFISVWAMGQNQGGQREHPGSRGRDGDILECVCGVTGS